MVIVSRKFLNCGFWVTVKTIRSHVEPSILDRLKCRNFILKMFSSFFLFKEKNVKEKAVILKSFTVYIVQTVPDPLQVHLNNWCLSHRVSMSITKVP